MGNDLKYGLVLGVVVLLIFVGYMTMKSRSGSKPLETGLATSTATTPAPTQTAEKPFDIMGQSTDTGTPVVFGGTTTGTAFGTGTQYASNNTNSLGGTAPTATYEISRPAPPATYGAPAPAVTTAPALGGRTTGTATALGSRPGMGGPALGGARTNPMVSTNSLPTVTPVEPSHDSAIKDLGIGTSTSEKSYTVAKGDTLASISKKYYGNAGNWQKIVDANKGVSPTNLKVGQKLVIPDAKAEVPTTTASKDTTSTVTATDTTTTAGGKSYTVAKGDTLAGISRKFYGTPGKWQKIVDANKGLDPKKLEVGQKITIP